MDLFFLSLLKDFNCLLTLLFNKPSPELVFDLPMGCANLRKIKMLVIFKQGHQNMGISQLMLLLLSSCINLSTQ